MATFKQFDHLMAFGISGARVPVRQIQSLLAVQTQLEVIEKILRQEESRGPTLAETREPDLARVNYAETVRGNVWEKWQRIVEDPAHIPPSQLLERLNATWAEAEKTIGDDVQKKVAGIFAERARKKAEMIEEDASRLAVESGLPATIQWLETLKKECTDARKRTGQELHRYGERRKRQAEALEKWKEGWATLLSSDEEEMGEIARRLFLIAGAALFAGVILWFLTIPANSIGGLVTISLFGFLVLHALRPLLRRFRLSRRMRVTAAQLASAYRASSLFSLDEMTKRLEMEYPEMLRDHIDRMLDAYRKRVALVRAKQTELETRRETLQKSLFAAPPTIRVLLRESALQEWYQQGQSQVPVSDWFHQLASLKQQPDWEQLEQEASLVFAFLRGVRAEEELYQLYPNREERMVFLQSLRDAAIGPAPGEAFLALDFAVAAGRPPQVHLLVELDDPDSSQLAAEIKSAWAGAAVGVRLERAADPAAITLIGLVYGFALEAQKEWDSIEAAFAKIQKEEGEAIYPVLFPKEEEETA